MANSQASAQSELVAFEGAGHGLVVGSHEELMHGEGFSPTYVDGYFETQFEWLHDIGIQ